MAKTLDELRKTYNLSGLKFEDQTGLLRVDVQTRLCRGAMYLHGAHVATWQPSGQQPVLWMSQQSNFQADKPIRGGIPICFPWFGPHPTDPSLPAHGLARTRSWELAEVCETKSGAIQLTCVTEVKPFRLSFTCEFGAELSFGLKTSLPSTHPERCTFQDALHTYLSVSDIRQVLITGLEETAYVDKMDGARIKPASGAPIEFTAETDRVYFDTSDTCWLQDAGMSRRIVVSKSGSQSTIVWNPWIEKSARMPDFGDDEWPGMVCIETGNVGSNAVMLEPGQEHTTQARIQVIL